MDAMTRATLCFACVFCLTLWAILGRWEQETIIDLIYLSFFTFIGCVIYFCASLARDYAEKKRQEEEENREEE